MKVDAELNLEIFKSLGFKRLPGVLFTIKGYQPVIYEGENSPYELKLFIRRIIQPIISELKTIEDVEKFKTYSNVVIIQFSKTFQHALYLAAKKFKHILFAFCGSKECLEKYNYPQFEYIILEESNQKTDNPKLDDKELTSSSVIKMFKTFDELENTLEKGVNESILDEFIDKYSYAELSFVSEHTFNRIFDLKKDTLILFDDSYKSYYQTLRSAVQGLKKYNLFIVYSDPSQNLNYSMRNALGITDSKVPTMVIATTKEDAKIFRYKQKGQPPYEVVNGTIELVNKILPITKNKIIEFANDWKYDQFYVISI